MTKTASIARKRPLHLRVPAAPQRPRGSLSIVPPAAAPPEPLLTPPIPDTIPSPIAGTIAKPAFDPRAFTRLELPARVSAWARGSWCRAWLIGRVHCADGWIGLVQYDDGTGREITTRIPADLVTLPTLR